ncbi:TonB-dependent receptor [Paludibacteraceae bacterium OttesenSCG-928-F17]|nr:TonB-dependent receptor [Paludibacteraceae bacterium OttesenSCG-928-F17]
MKLKTLFLFLFILFASTAIGQSKIRIYGYVIDQNNRGIEFANVYFEGTTVGTSTNVNGYYDLMAEIKDSVTIVYSMLGYETIKHTFDSSQKIYAINVQMQPSSVEIEEIDVVAQRIQNSNVETLDPTKYRFTPNAAGGIESLFITFAGVTSNNELSSQYNVRGGNFDENLVYVNGIEVYRPLLIRSGQQEGLSFINPDMVEKVDFASGAFAAEYGDKMSSVLDIKYKKPKKFESSVSLSLLGATAYLGTAHKKFTQMHGFRYKTSAYLLGTLDTKAEYTPTFLDYQTYLTYDFSPEWELTFLGNFSQNSYLFIPEVQETTFGTYNNSRKFKVYFDGQEKDIFRTAFGAFSLNFKPTQNLRLSLIASTFHTNENESYDISGSYWLNEVNMDSNGESEEGEALGIGKYHEHARNRLRATVANVGHQGEYNIDNNKLKWGVTVQREIISDKLDEWEWRDSMGYSLPNTHDRVSLISNLKSDNRLDSYRFSAYIQDTYKLNADIGRFSFTGGVRAAYWSFNNEFIASPRVLISYVPYWKHDFSFRFATGIYYQSPFYKEVRKDSLDPQTGNVTFQLNKDIKSQRSAHFLLGGDYYFRAWGRPFKFTTEAYLKLADRVISYTVDNVSIRYSGENDAIAYTAGIDFKLFGELVPGTDSWINFSLMNSKEKLTKEGTNNDWVPRPTEQRYSFSMLFSDYLPNNPKYKLHLKFIWSDGLPFGVPNSQEYRAAFRANDYKRVDIGASRGFVSGVEKFMSRRFFKHFQSIWLNFEILNLFDFKNVNSYYWVTDAYGYENAVPNYLTGRQYNFKIMIDFK